jgi:hypothetical protein
MTNQCVENTVKQMRKITDADLFDGDPCVNLCVKNKSHDIKNQDTWKQIGQEYGEKKFIKP